MKSTSMDIPVHDVAPLLEIHEYSLVWFAVLIICVFIVSYSVLMKMRLRGKPKEPNERQKSYERLMHVDLSDSKKAAYAISNEASFFAQDNESMQSDYRILLEHLERYKYAPNVEPIDKEALALYRSYCQMIVV